MDFRNHLSECIDEFRRVRRKKDILGIIIALVFIIPLSFILPNCLRSFNEGTISIILLFLIFIFFFGYFALELIRMKILTKDTVISRYEEQLSAFGDVNQLYEVLSETQPLNNTKLLEIRMNQEFCSIIKYESFYKMYVFPTKSILSCTSRIVGSTPVRIVGSTPVFNIEFVVDGERIKLSDSVSIADAGSIVNQIRQYNPDVIFKH